MTDQQRDRAGALTDLKYIGPATAEIIASAGFDADDVRRKRVSYRVLVEEGANPGVATKLRREHSLPWSNKGAQGEDLSKRSDQVRGLKDEERAWVAASSGDWERRTPKRTTTREPEATEADGSGKAEQAEAAWRERSKPDPVTEVEGITEEIANRLGSAGINSVRSLATADPESVSDVLGFDEREVEEWIENATEIA